MPDDLTAADGAATTLTRPPPGATVADDALLDVAVAELNRIYAAKGLETARAIGEYVLATLFDGDLDAYRAHARTHASFRALARRDDLRVSYSFIANAVAIVDQLRLLPDDVAEALPATHHKLLLPVKDEAAKATLAQRAVEEGLTSRELAAEVQRQRDAAREGARRGRPSTPAFAKAFARLRQVSAQAAAEPVEAAVFARYSPDKARELLAETEAAIAGLTATAEAVRAALEAWGKETRE